MLSYDFKIKPLREPGSSKLLPAVVNHRVPGGIREGRSKTNRAEAEEIVSLMMSCMRQPEYEGKTFGVISLLGGGNQVKLIQQIMFSRMSLKEIESRKILVGDPASFQGDERDVIFLSLVDGNDGEGPLRLLGNGVDDAMKKRYNVAASRAKDQLWVVHSLDHANDLKGNDLRKTLIEYAKNPEAFARRIDKVKAFAESPFEEAVGKALIAKGYRIVQQWEVGSYRLDIVVIGKDGRAAIECDGELWHSGDDKIRDDMERQAILERIGWRFVRIRGSEYYRDPDGAMERVCADLAKLGIEPDGLDVLDDGEQEKSELLQRVLAGLNRDDSGQEEQLFGLSRTETIAAALDCREAPAEFSAPVYEKLESSVKTKHEHVAGSSSRKRGSIKGEPVKQASLFDQIAGPCSDADQVVELDSADACSEVDQKHLVAEKPFERSDQDKPKDIEAAGEPKDQVMLALEEKGLTAIDKRGVNGNLWVLGDFTIGNKVRNVAREFNVRFEYVSGGSRATGHQSGWYMVGKSIYRPESKPLHYVPVNGKLPERTVEDRASNRVFKSETGEKREQLVSGVVNVNVSKRGFEAAELHFLDIGNASFYTDSRYYAEIKKRMEQIIEKEAPVEKQRLFNAVRGALGVKRSGAEIQAHNEWILSKIPHQKTRFSDCDFIWANNQCPEEYNEYRPNGENGERKYSEIPYEEIEAAIKDSLSRTVYCGRDALIERIKTAFELKRTTDNLRDVFGKAID